MHCDGIDPEKNEKRRKQALEKQAALKNKIASASDNDLENDIWSVMAARDVNHAPPAIHELRLEEFFRRKTNRS